jgi:(p)ppGpp synthase/HD superfamily hydrolase
VKQEQAFAYVAEQFKEDERKGTQIPYLSHLVSVAALVMEAGGDDVQVAAAFLHDSPEDKGGEAELQRIEAEFGADVAAIVRDLSDSLVDTTKGETKRPWKERKEQYLEHLRNAPERSLLVSAADKLHNARCIVADLRLHHEQLWKRFNAPAGEQLWYYDRLVEIFRERLADSSLTAELQRTVGEMRSLVAGRQP